MSDHSNKPGYLKTMLFAFAMCMVCGSLLTVASTGLKAYQQKNIALDVRAVKEIHSADLILKLVN